MKLNRKTLIKNKIARGISIVRHLKQLINLPREALINMQIKTRINDNARRNILQRMALIFI